MKTILIIAGFGYSLLLFRKELITVWVNKGYRVVAAAPELEVKDSLSSIGAEYNTIPLQRNALNPFADFKLLISILWLLKREKPDYLFLYTIKPVVYGSLAAHFFRQPRVFSMITGLGYAFVAGDESSLLRKLVSFLYRIALIRNEKVFFQNPDDREYFIDYKLVEKEKAILVNGSGVNLDYYNYEEPSSGQTVFLMISRLLKEKGILEYLNAARIIKIKYPAIKFQLICWDLGDNHSLFIKEEMEKCKTEGWVEIYGETDNVKAYLKAASVYVLPSYREGTPRTVLEAMAIGRPIITTDTQGCRETVEEGVNGFLVPVKDSKALALAMERFIQDPALIEKMGRVSRMIAEEKYNVHDVNRVINRVLGIE